MRRLDGCA